MTAPVTAPTTAVKSNVITNLSAGNVVRSSAGAGGPGRINRMVATITPGASQATSGLLRMVRIPSNAIVQKVAVIFDALPGTTIFDCGLWYSDNANDGTSPINAGNLTAISSAFFASVLTATTYTYVPGTDPAGVGVSAPVDITFAACTLAFTDANYVPSQSVYPIWQAVANLLALQTTPVGAFTKTSQQAHFNTASAGGSVYVRSDDPGGFFDIGIQYTTTGVTANQPLTMFVDVLSPGL